MLRELGSDRLESNLFGFKQSEPSEKFLENAILQSRLLYREKLIIRDYLITAVSDLLLGLKLIYIGGTHNEMQEHRFSGQYRGNPERNRRGP